MPEQGTIVAVSTSPNSGYPKYPQPLVTVGKWGFEGDVHNREMRPRFRDPTKFKPNVDRQITIVGIELLMKLQELTGKPLPVGSLSENITTEGLGDLTDLQPGQFLQIGEGPESVMMTITEHNEPCKDFHARFGTAAMRYCVHRRGLLCAISAGVGKIIRPGMPIFVC